jgi:hypothetical protein
MRGRAVVGDTDVTIPVPLERRGAFYEWFGRWQQADDNVVAVPKARVVPLTSTPWSVEDDAGLAASLAHSLSAAAREVLAIVTDQPGTPVEASFIAARSGGATAADVAQLVAEVALAADDRGRCCPIRWTDAGGSASYWLPAAAALFWTTALAPPAPPAAPGEPVPVPPAPAAGR